MAWELSTSGSAIKSAGANVNSTITADGDQLAVWSDQIQNEICDVTRYDVIANWASLTENGKELIAEICDAKIAQKIISYEPEAIGTIGASLRLNFLQNLIAQGMAKLDDGKIKKYLTIPS